MAAYPHTLSDGRTIVIELKRSAKKNLILRPLRTDALSINIPPFLTLPRLQTWLADNEALLLKTLSKTPMPADTGDQLPDWIWFNGFQTALSYHPHPHIELMPSEIRLPQQADTARQRQHLRRFLNARAAERLLPRLRAHVDAVKLQSAAMALSNAKTFWGVCRHNTGIRLNWRLIGAPDFVVDYVCLHELCHLPHPNHSAAFWQLLNRYTPHTEAAKAWLKVHGNELFALG